MKSNKGMNTLLKHTRLSFSTLLSTLLLSNTVYAGAYQLYEMGTPIIGRAGVGQAVTDDASSSYFNPASMNLSDKTKLMLGSQILIPYANFSKSTTNTIRGNNGGNAGALTPGMNLYLIYRYSDKIKYGMSVNTPYGGQLNYADGWAGRFVVQGVTFYTIDFNPSIAYQVNEQISVGAGITLEYINLQETVALPITNLIDGQVKMSLANTSAGFNVGALYTPFKTTNIGLTYRSQIIHDLHGSSTFLRIGDTPDTSTKMVMPTNMTLSAKQTVSDRFTLLGELGWANWSAMRNTVLTVRNYTAVTPRSWINTYRLGAAGQFKFSQKLMAQLGVSYDSSPTSASKRLPDLPMDRQIRCGAGIIYDIIKDVELGASYEYINFGNADINNSSSNGVLAGSYSRNYANTFQVSLNVTA